MEPFTPNDPLHQLLARARSVEVRPDFKQNVLRAVRQDPTPLGIWARMQDWFASFAGPQRLAAGALAALIVTAIGGVLLMNPEGQDPRTALAQTPAVPEVVNPSAAEPLLAEEDSSLETVVASDLDSMNQLSVLLAQQDTSALTDNEIAVLLY